MNYKRLLSLLTGLVGVRFLGAVAGVTTQIILARTLSQSDMGLFFLGLAIASFVGMIMTGGYNLLAITQLSRYRTLQRQSLVSWFIRTAVKDTAILVGILLALGAAALMLWPLDAGLRTIFYVGLAAAPAAAIIRIQSAIANTYRKFAISFVPDFLIRPLLLFAAVLSGLAILSTVTLVQVMLAFLGIIYLIAALQFILLRRAISFPNITSATSHRAVPIWRKRAAALIIVALVTIAFTDIVMLVGGLFLQPDQLAILGVCVRLAVLVGFVTQACSQFVLPDLTDAMIRAGHDGAGPVLLRANILSIGVSTAALIGTFILGDFALGIFGPEYSGHYLLLATLIVGQILRSGASMNMQLLSLGGQQTRIASVCVASLFVMLLLSALLSPHFGVYGVAFGAVGADMVWAFGTGYMAQRKLSYRGDIFALLPFMRKDAVTSV